MKKGKDLNRLYRELRQRNSLTMVDRGIFKSYLEPKDIHFTKAEWDFLTEWDEDFMKRHFKL